jgi:D-galactarolactone cycloisomerase
MKIREIRAAGLRGRTPKGGWSNELRPEDCVHTLIAILTDEELVGWGSASTSDNLIQAALSVLRPLYEGESAVEPERVSEKLHQHTFWLGRGGSLTHAISGIDIALWDLLGQATGQPVGRLLGGRYRDRVKAYASLLMTEPDHMADELLPVKEQGFRAFKIGWGPFGRRDAAIDEAIVRAAREAVGPDCALMVDAGASDAFWPQDYKWALRTARMLADYNVTWFEEPLLPDDLQDYAALRRAGFVPIAGGEVLTRRQSFRPWLETGALDVVQPDVTKVGGISEARRIGWMADEHGVRLIPHGWNTALGLAADLQLASALPKTEFVEYLTGSPFIDELAIDGWKLEDGGTLKIPELPGLGIRIDLRALESLSGLKHFLD